MIAPQNFAAAPEKSAAAPEKSAAAPEKSAAAPEKRPTAWDIYNVRRFAQKSCSADRLL
jgi:hypothetical protein